MQVYKLHEKWMENIKILYFSYKHRIINLLAQIAGKCDKEEENDV